MSTIAAQLIAKVSADTKEAEIGLDQMQKKADETKGFFGKLLGKIGDFAGAALVFAGVNTGLGLLQGAVSSVFDEMGQMQTQTSQLNAVLQSTQDASGESAQAVLQLSENLSDLSGASEANVLSGENMLLTFTNIGQNVFPQASQALDDLAIKMANGDAANANYKDTAIQLGKALNDPITGITALTRVGVTFTEQQKKQIKAMMDAGDTAGAQGVILKELEREFGGSAKAAGETFSGSLDKLKNKLIEIGANALEPVVAKVTPLISAFSDWLPGALSTAGQSLQQVGGFVESKLMPPLQQLEKTVQPIITTVVTWAEKNDVLGKGVTVVKVALGDLVSGIGIAITIVNGIITGIEAVVQWFGQWHTAVLSVGTAILAFFLPALINAGIQAAISGAQIAAGFIADLAETGTAAVVNAAQVTGSFVASMVEAGAQGYASAGQVLVFVASLAATGAGAVANAAKVTASFVASMVTSGAQAVASAARITASFVATLVQTGIQAAITGGAMLVSLVPAIIAVVAQALVAAATAVPALIAGFIAWAASAGAAALATIAATWPILAMIAAIALLVAGIILLATHWKQVWSEISSFALNIWHGLEDAWNSVWNGITGAVQAVWGGITGFIKGGINDIIDIINWFIKKIDSIGIDVGPMHIHPNIPTIPHLAAGGTVISAGDVLVGEDGPEILRLPAGAQVIPLSGQAAAGANGGAGGAGQPIILEVDGKRLARVLLPHMPGLIANATGVRNF